MNAVVITVTAVRQRNGSGRVVIEGELVLVELCPPEAVAVVVTDPATVYALLIVVVSQVVDVV